MKKLTIILLGLGMFQALDAQKYKAEFSTSNHNWSFGEAESISILIPNTSVDKSMTALKTVMSSLDGKVKSQNSQEISFNYLSLENNIDKSNIFSSFEQQGSNTVLNAIVKNADGNYSAKSAKPILKKVFNKCIYSLYEDSIKQEQIAIESINSNPVKTIDKTAAKESEDKLQKTQMDLMDFICITNKGILP